MHNDGEALDQPPSEASQVGSDDNPIPPTSASTTSPALDAQDVDTHQAERSMRRRWPLVLLLVLLFGGATAALVYHLSRPEIHLDRVLLIVRSSNENGQLAYSWSRDNAAWALEKECGKALRALGFELALGQSEEREAFLEQIDWDNACSLAPDFGASTVLRLDLAIQHSAPLDLHSTDFSIALSADYCDVEEGKYHPIEATLLFFEWGSTGEEAMQDVVYRATQASLAPIAAALSSLPRIAPLGQSSAKLDREQLKLSGRFDPLFRLAGHYQRELERRADEARLAARNSEARDSSPMRFENLSSPLSEEYYIGALPGEDLLFLEEPHFVDVLVSTGEYDIRRESERLLAFSPNNSDEANRRRLIFEHFNFYSAPAISADGSVIAAVLDNRQRSKWLVAVRSDDASLQLLASSASHYYSSPSLAPDGSRVVFWESPRRRAPSTLELIELDSGTQRRLLEANWNMSYPRFGDGPRFVYLAIGESERTAIVRIDTESSAVELLLGTDPFLSADDAEAVLDAPPNEEQPEEASDGGEEVEPEPTPSRFDQPMPSADGRFVYVAEAAGDGDFLGRLCLATRSYERLVPLSFLYAELSPNAEWLAFSSRARLNADDPSIGDTEIAVLHLPTQSLQVLTSNDLDEQLQGWSRDSKHVFIGRHRPDPTGQRYTANVLKSEALLPPSQGRE
jgi:hypothetical protein